MIPFAIIGLGVAIKLWHSLPDATKRYNAEILRRKQGLTLPEIRLD
jgi:tRNA U55 pseudouridine synthase TruB